MGWLALAVVFAGCRHPLASPYPALDPLDLAVLLAGAGGAPDAGLARMPVPAIPSHPFQTVFAYLGLLLAAGVAAGTAARRASGGRLPAAAALQTPADIARQLNHDVKNGVVPVRNVFRHLAQVARHEPERLPAVFLERQATVEAGLAYLETLARNYAERPSATCDLNAVVAQVAQGLVDAPAVIDLDLGGSLPAVAGDPVAIRRVIENLAGNAIESLLSRRGMVTFITRAVHGSDPRRVRLTVADTGRGMTRRELDRAFDDFYSTKPGGTGLGLSVVRRLAMTLHAAIRVDTAPGVGTRFTIELPAAS